MLPAFAPFRSWTAAPAPNGTAPTPTAFRPSSFPAAIAPLLTTSAARLRYALAPTVVPASKPIPPPTAASAPAACVPHVLFLLVRRSLQVLIFPRVCPKLSPGSGMARLTVRRASQGLGQVQQPAYPNTRLPPTPYWVSALVGCPSTIQHC